MQQARTDIRACSTEANQSADTAMVGTSIGMALAGGLVGLAATASDDSDLRARAEANGMDACLSRSGYSRRILTQAELDALDARTDPNRTALLDYLVAGGDLATYPGV
ncbi:hypothetical protein [Pontivivens ytuae]|uniref:Uncharacterized protein n=1 Tax=Pontivivens ytuae TaxID=2789856 RepID=A0A7S9LPF7_9RHOB|nr:hypothetical protein [Pontivivens ytuae]QPH52859.1 hypothetical protein I0K15_13710 [Pontivivens ytuae]